MLTECGIDLNRINEGMPRFNFHRNVKCIIICHFKKEYADKFFLLNFQLLVTLTN